MIKTDKIGEEMHLPLVNDCLIKEKAATIKKINLDVGLKKTKKKLENIFSHERRFEVSWAKEVNLEEVFQYHVIPVPLSLALPDSILRKNPKHYFVNQHP